MAAKRRRRPTRRKAAVRRRRPATRRAPARRRYRRNPAITARGITRQLTRGVQDAAVIVVGKGVTNTIANFIPVNGGMAVDLAKRAAAAIVTGMLAKQFMSADAARFALAGGLTAPIETFVKGLNIPFVSGALGFYDGQGYYAVGSYPQMPAVAAGVEAYPMAASLAGVSQYPAEEAYYSQQV